MELKTKEIETDVLILEGFCYSKETGELLYPAEKEGFKVDDQRSAEWLGEKLMGLDADIAALELQKQAVCQNVDRMIADKKRHRDGMTFRYGAQLEAYAKANLPKGKRTWTCPFVSVAFRTVKAGFKSIVDMKSQNAIDWAETNCPQAIKTERSVLVSLIPDEVKEANGYLFEQTPERETCKIETGVGAQ